jgi:hypothetical protein
MTGISIYITRLVEKMQYISPKLYDMNVHVNSMCANGGTASGGLSGSECC